MSVAALATLVGANARIAEVSQPQPLLQGVQSNLYNPVLSPDGSKLMFSAADYTDLRVYDFDLGVTVKVADAPRAGFEARFTEDSRTITYVTTDGTPGAMHRTYRYDIARRNSVEAGAPSRSKGMSARSAAGNSVRTRGNVLYLTVNGVETEYSPVEAAAYLWASLSPDGSKAMFVAAGQGVVVTDLNGKVTARIPALEAPVWMGNDLIVGQRSADDGHQFRSSQIILARADGSEEQALTVPESMTFTPAASEAAGRIVYATFDGRLYMVNVTLK